MTTLEAAKTTEGAAASSTQTPAVTAATAAPTTATLLGEQQASKTTEQAKAGEAKSAPVAKAPAEYKFKAPEEGHALDSEVLKVYGEVARELDLPQEAAQKVIDKLAPVMRTRAQQVIETLRNEWRDSSKADKEFGGDKLKESLAIAGRALDKFGTPELRKLLDDSGAGDHAELIRFMVRVGKAISDDTIVTGSAGPKAQAPIDMNDPDALAAKLYPTHAKKG